MDAKPSRWSDMGMSAAAILLCGCWLLALKFKVGGESACRQWGETAKVETHFMRGTCLMRVGDFFVICTDPNPEDIRDRFRSGQYVWAPLPPKAPAGGKRQSRAQLLEKRDEYLKRMRGRPSLSWHL